MVFTGNRMHGNGYQGAMFESSHGLRIEGNVAWGNGFLGAPWAWGGGIVLSSSDHAVVRGNLLAWNADGITVISQARGDDRDHEGIAIEDNTVLSADRPGDPDAFTIAWVQDWAGRLCDPSSGNTASANRVWSPRPDALAYAWCGRSLDLGTFATVPGGSGTAAITTQEAMALAAAAGLAWTPVVEAGPGPWLADFGTRLAGAGLLLAALAGLVRRRHAPARDGLGAAALLGLLGSLPLLVQGSVTGLSAVVAGIAWAAAGVVAVWAMRRREGRPPAPLPGAQVPH